MYIVSHRPHTIRKIEDNFWHQAPNGDSVTEDVGLGPVVSCRYEQNGSASTITLPDGQSCVYHYTVYLDADSPVFAYGDTVEMFGKGGASIGRFTVLGFQRSQLNCKLWV